MKFDVFLSICQTEVDGHTPNERQMFESFFDQARLADELGYETAWVAETHLSCQVQKENADAVIPHFKGEIGLNTDILQVAHLLFSQTKRINVGSAIRNIICNGGPIAHAEAVRTFLTLNSMQPSAKRKLELGFAAGRFPFSNTPYGMVARTELEKTGWDVIKNKYFAQGAEIFLRFLRGEKLASKEISTQYLQARDFRDPAQWERVQSADQKQTGGPRREKIPLECHWTFDKVGVIPFEAPLENLRLTLGSHDPEVQIAANQFFPVGVFNLSITPEKVIEETHARMRQHYHKEGGAWRRDLMPRTVLLFLDETPGLSPAEQSQRAKAQAKRAWENYWKAMEKTLDPAKVESAVSNTIAGNAAEVTELIKAKYHPEDRLMLWFDFNNHDNEAVKASMRIFMEQVAPRLG
jgi:alkanesulfonate monooxygenase SsuD/methylene tetrahydromethanopterin reductase-like flavin-dependent oxidoreductase (luciferase family)